MKREFELGQKATWSNFDNSAAWYDAFYGADGWHDADCCEDDDACKRMHRHPTNCRCDDCCANDDE